MKEICQVGRRKLKLNCVLFMRDTHKAQKHFLTDGK